MSAALSALGDVTRGCRETNGSRLRANWLEDHVSYLESVRISRRELSRSARKFWLQCLKVKISMFCLKLQVSFLNHDRLQPYSRRLLLYDRRARMKNPFGEHHRTSTMVFETSPLKGIIPRPSVSLHHNKHDDRYWMSCTIT